LFEDIFEAEDALSPDIDISDLPTEFFSPLTVDCSTLLLHSSVVRRLSKYIDQVARPTKRIRLSARDGATGGAGTPRSKGRMAEVDTLMLSKALKILERSVRAGQDLDPFPNALHTQTSSPRKTVPKKSSKSSKKAEDVDHENTYHPSPESNGDGQLRDLTDLQLEHLTRQLEVARDSILAADCCIALLGSDRLAKQVWISANPFSSVPSDRTSYSCILRSSSPHVLAPLRTN
jgi:cohesin loading factor subunit SCC2